jgi:hypothetical protein
LLFCLFINFVWFFSWGVRAVRFLAQKEKSKPQKKGKKGAQKKKKRGEANK